MWNTSLHPGISYTHNRYYPAHSHSTIHHLVISSALLSKQRFRNSWDIKRSALLAEAWFQGSSKGRNGSFGPCTLQTDIVVSLTVDNSTLILVYEISTPKILIWYSSLGTRRIQVGDPTYPVHVPLVHNSVYPREGGQWWHIPQFLLMIQIHNYIRKLHHQTSYGEGVGIHDITVPWSNSQKCSP